MHYKEDIPLNNDNNITDIRNTEEVFSSKSKPKVKKNYVILSEIEIRSEAQKYKKKKASFPTDSTPSEEKMLIQQIQQIQLQIIELRKSKNEVFADYHLSFKRIYDYQTKSNIARENGNQTQFEWFIQKMNKAQLYYNKQYGLLEKLREEILKLQDQKKELQMKIMRNKK